MAWGSWLAAAFGARAASPPVQAVGPFTVEAVERSVGTGGFPNTSGNPFRRTPVTTFRVLHRGRPVPPPGNEPDGGAPWWDVRVLVDAPQPALLLMQTGAQLLTEADGRAQLRELAPMGSSRTRWQWLDARQGQPGEATVVAIAHRPDEPRALGGGRWLWVYHEAVVDVKTLAVHRVRFTSSEVQQQLQRWYAADSPVLAFSPGQTRIVVAASRDQPGSSDPATRFEHALVAWDFAAGRGTVLPVVLADWRLHDPTGIDAAFARKVLAWRRGADGGEVASLRQDLALTWLGRLAGREMDALSYQLQPVLPAMQAAFVRFLESEAGAVVAPAGGGSGVDVRIEGLTLALRLDPRDRRLSLFYASDWQRKREAERLIERLGERFNARLAAGEHQQLFAGAPPGQR